MNHSPIVILIHGIFDNPSHTEHLANFLTEKGIDKLFKKYKNPIIPDLIKWLLEIIKEMRIDFLKNSNDNDLIEKIKNKPLLLNTENMVNIENTENNSHFIYIYNTDSRKPIPELKIGHTKNIKQRIKSYTIICTHGVCELCEEVPNIDINIVESYIHTLLEFYKIKGEVFQLNIEKAKLIVLNVINLSKIITIQDDDTDLKLLKLYQEECILMKNKPITIYNHEKCIKTNNLNDNFDEFIEKFCIIRPDVEINAKDIIGQHRLWSRNTKKEVTMSFKDYLDTRFKYTRLRNQGKDQSVYGYTGVTLIEIEHKRSLNPTDLEMFVFEKCVFSQGGTILKSTLVEQYVEWKQNVKKNIKDIKEEELEIVQYFKNNQHVLYSTVWTTSGSGQGYYGLMLKSNVKQYKKSSTTSKKVFKRLVETNALLGTWETIAKAADMENVCSAKMSRYIKNNVTINDYYYSLK